MTRDGVVTVAAKNVLAKPFPDHAEHDGGHIPDKIDHLTD